MEASCIENSSLFGSQRRPPLIERSKETFEDNLIPLFYLGQRRCGKESMRER